MCVVRVGEQDRDRLGSVDAVAGDYGSGANTRLLEQRGFKVSGIDVQPCGSHDDVAATA